MKKTFELSLAKMRKIVALGVICTLFFAVVSCDNATTPFEYEEPKTEELPTPDEKEEEKEMDGNACPCDVEMFLWEKQFFPRGEVLLFKDRTDGFRIEEPFIIYHSEYNMVFLYLPPSYWGSSLRGQGLICNFPDFAKEWLNYENGVRVYIEGVMYEYRNFPHWAVVIPFGYMLTSIKKK